MLHTREFKGYQDLPKSNCACSLLHQIRVQYQYAK